MSRDKKSEYASLRELVADEVREALEKIEPARVEELADVLTGADRIFVVGAGRSFLMMKALAKRLKHLGLDACVVGETTQPALRPGDWVIAGSASGRTTFTVETARTARKLGGRVAVLTASAGSPLARLADIRVIIPAPTKLKQAGEVPSGQPMGNRFEQTLLLLNDIISMMVQRRLGLSEADLRKRHANLE